MRELVTQYSTGQILLFIIVFALGVKEFLTFKDWAIAYIKQAVEKRNGPIEDLGKQKQEIKQLKDQLNQIGSQVELLLRSNRDMLRHSITKDHHYFCYKIKSIDDYSLSCLEQQFENYEAMGGNSFVQQLMREVRELPRKIEKDNR